MGDDADYSHFLINRGDDSARYANQRETTRARNVEKIATILNTQFTNELEMKERDIDTCEERISQSKCMLDKLRAYVLANYFGAAEKVVPAQRKRRRKMKRSNTDVKVKREAETVADTISSVKTLLGGGFGNERVILSSIDRGMVDASLKNTLKIINPNSKKSRRVESPEAEGMTRLSPELNCVLQDACQNVSTSGISTPTKMDAEATAFVRPPQYITTDEQRLHVKRNIIIGNISKYLESETRKENDSSTHKWLVYVRGPKEDADICDIISGVTFFLHPSYMPNDVVHVRKAPFQLTRRGWGEFPVRVQLHFQDGRNKKLDVIHNLKLDKTYTGLQTLGAETIVELELHGHTSSSSNLGDRTPSKESPADLKKSWLWPSTPLRGASSRTDDGNSPGFPSHRKQNSETSDSGFSGSLDSTSSIEDSSSGSSLVMKDVVTDGNAAFMSCANSLESSPCGTPSSKDSDLCSGISMECSMFLQQLVHKFPLINPNRELCEHPFAATSFEQYSGWAIGKRRANEWHRALHLKQLLMQTHTVMAPPSTKSVMTWCRRYGYTPTELLRKPVLPTKDTIKYRPCCGRVMDDQINDENNPSFDTAWCGDCTAHYPGDVNKGVSALSRTGVNKGVSALSRTGVNKGVSALSRTLLMNMSSNEKRLCSVESLRERSVDEEVDVTGDSDNSRGGQPNIKHLPERRSSDEMEWVTRTAQDVNIHLPPVIVNSTRMPVLSGMLLSAVQSFARELMSLSNAQLFDQNSTRSLEPGEVRPSHVLRAVSKTERFDFLTLASLGKDPCADVKDEDNTWPISI